MGVALDSIVAPGVIVSGARVQRSVLSPGVRVNSYSAIDDSILLSNAEIGRHCHLRRTIVCPNAKVYEGTRAGFDAEQDRARGYTVTESGITVIAADVPQFPSTGLNEGAGLR